MKKFILYASACLLFACEEQGADPQTNTKHPITLGFAAIDNSSSRSESSQSVDAVAISIKDGDGNSVYSMEKIDLIAIGDGYITKELELSPGRYTVEDFIVVDKEDAALYITPKKGSETEKLVRTPLPYSFEVVSGDTNNVVLDVISAELGNAADFGYATFSFNVIPDLEAGLVA